MPLSRKRGFVVITMAVAAVALCGALGLAFDLGRMFIAKSETQAYSDAASLAAALKLNGTTDGISHAQEAAAKTSNAWNLDSTKVSNSQLDFATNISGPWDPNPNPAAGYRFARVRSTVPSQLYFLPIVVGQSTQDVAAGAVAAQTQVTSFKRGLGPFTVVAPDPLASDFGLVVGNQYDIQWPQYNGSRAGCSALTPEKCFNSLPCNDDPPSSRAAVVQYWGANINGYWGGNAASTIYQEVLDLIQLQVVEKGDQIFLTAGDKQSEAKALDLRVNSDLDLMDNSVKAYLDNLSHNGMRLIPLPVVQPTAEGTIVQGYGAFLLISNANSGTLSNYYQAGTGNEPFCAIYAGCYVQGSTDPGACPLGSVSGGGESGAYKVSLVR